MILKTKDGHYVELSGSEYTQFVSEIMLYFERDKKLEMHFHNDGRIKASELIFDQIAKQGAGMEENLKQNYLKLAHELLSSYNNDIQSGRLEKPDKI